jgi:hypothetical protein
MAMATSSTRFAALVVKRDILVKIVPIVRNLSSTMFIIVIRSLGVIQMTLVPLKWLFHKGRAQKPFEYLSP